IYYIGGIMLIDSRKGRFKVIRNYRDAFKLEIFEERYIEECFDKYIYIVGDISSGILRLKGFDVNPKSKNYFGFIEDYLDLSCAMGCPHFVLKRIQSDNEYQREMQSPTDVISEGLEIHSVGKESFDKDNLILLSTAKEDPNIVIDAEKINRIPKGTLPQELKDSISQEQPSLVSENVEPSQSYISSSPGFVPNQNRNNFRKNNKKKNKK
ncbi:MAG: YutD family protein, partial [Anaeroplasmataceae bacterium]|nr:YutD family protein [Anaeroplasmataceae bacterium]